MISAKVQSTAGHNSGVGIVDTVNGSLRCVMSPGRQPGQNVAVSMRPDETVELEIPIEYCRAVRD